MCSLYENNNRIYIGGVNKINIYDPENNFDLI
jgi:hypothetical protein